METLLEIINQIRLNKELAPLQALTPSMHLRNDCGLDSFDLAELTVIVEDKMGVDLFEKGIIYTIEEVMERIASN